MVLILGKPETSGWVNAMLQSGPFLVGLVGDRGMVEASQPDAKARERRTKYRLGFCIAWT